MKKSHIETRTSERGGAGAKLLMAIVVLLLIVNAGYNFIPVAYRGENFKQEMKTAVIQGVSLPSTYGEPKSVVKFKLTNAVRVHQLPVDTYIDVKQARDVISARVYYTETIALAPFGIYDYQYVFDHTATPSGFLTQSQ